MKIWLIFLGVSLYSAFSFGAREISLPPILMNSIHGAVICTNPGPAAYKEPHDLINLLISQTALPPVLPASALPTCLEVAFCGSADMNGLEPISLGMTYSRHVFSISLNNISNIDQTITVVMKSGSSFATRKNGVFKAGALEPSGPENTLILNKDRSIVATLTPSGTEGSSFAFLFGSFCDGSTCQNKIFPMVFNNIVCLQHRSEVIFKIHVVEDRGAVQGTISYFAHRAYGQMDRFSESTTLDISGGRPF